MTIVQEIIAAKPASKPRQVTKPSLPGQIVLVLQGGGALGAYQAGVYQALHEAGIEPDWVIGTSIGAINAGIIAGNEVNNRLPNLREFWRRVERREFLGLAAPWHGLVDAMANFTTLIGGVPGFFQPNPPAFWGPYIHLGVEKAGYYSTTPLEATLGELVDCSLLNRCKPRLTVGVASVRTSQMHYFDARETEITVRHIMASGALPPAFPAIRIGENYYWDGGILSNTPTEAIFDDNPRRDSVIFAVHMWNPTGEAPETIWEVLHRQKDIQYSSRVASHIARQRQAHRLRHVISQLLAHVPDKERNTPEVRELAGYGCMTQMHVVQLLAPRLANEDHTKDIDFSASGIRARWEAGYADTQRAVAAAPWEGKFDPLEGVILHRPRPFEFTPNQ
jgi:NTE family protein